MQNEVVAKFAIFKQVKIQIEPIDFGEVYNTELGKE